MNQFQHLLKSSAPRGLVLAAVFLIVAALGVGQGRQERFDLLVRDDFFAGFGGDREALDRALKKCEDKLSEDPDHGEALVWHGSGLFYLSGVEFQTGNPSKGMELWNRALNEMNRAVELEPRNVATRIPRGATLLTAVRQVPAPMRPQLADWVVEDFEIVLELQKAYFNQLSEHARGELLSGLAEGWLLKGDRGKAAAYLERVQRDLPDTVYSEQASEWLAQGESAKPIRTCLGCHVD